MVREDTYSYLLDNSNLWMEGLLSIPTREGSMVDMKLSNFQNYYVSYRDNKDNPLRRVICKPRQIFASTVILASNFKDLITLPGTRVLVMTHHDDATDLMRLTVKQWCAQLKSIGLLPEIENDSAGLLSFKNLNSFMVFQTAGGRFGGRSTAFNRLHLSEVAHWPGDPEKMLAGIIPSAPKTAQIDMESTPNGSDGPFYNFYIDAKNKETEWGSIFWPWFNNPDYVRDIPERGLNLSMKDKLRQGKYKISDEHMAWFKWMESELRRTTRSDEARSFDQEYPWDDITCFLGNVDGVLNADILQEYIELISPPIMNFEDWDIWKGPKDNYPYVMAADTSEGKFDYSASHIMDGITLEVVARYHGKPVPHQFAEILLKGARMYGNPLMVVETPGPGERVIDRLQLTWGYDHLYYYEDDTTGKVNEDAGWPQNVKTRGIVIDTLQTMTNQRAYRVYDERTVRELSSLTWKRVGNMRRPRAEAGSGAHDDLAFSLGLNLATAHVAVKEWRKKMGTDGRRHAMINQGFPVDASGQRIVSMRSYI